MHGRRHHDNERRFRHPRPRPDRRRTRRGVNFISALMLACEVSNLSASGRLLGGIFASELMGPSGVSV